MKDIKIGNFTLPAWVAVLMGFFGVVVFLVLCLFMWVISSLNGENALRNQLVQRNNTAKTKYASSYKILETQYSFNKEQNEWAKSVYLGVAEGRYKNDNNLQFKVVNEAPQSLGIDQELAKKFFNSVQIELNKVAHQFDDLAELKRKHDTLLDSIPQAIWFRLAGREKIEIVYVIDSATNGAFKTGIDDRKIVK